MPKKPTSDKEYLEYQKEVCPGCRNQFNLKRGIFDKGCMPVDLYAMATPDKMIRDDGTCIFREVSENSRRKEYTLEDLQRSFEGGHETIWEDLEQTSRIPKYDTFDEWFNKSKAAEHLGVPETQVKVSIKPTRRTK